MSDHNKQSGASLFEILIGLSVLSVLAVGLAVSIQTSTRATAQITSRAETVEEVRIAERVLRYFIASTAWTGINETEWRFEGRTDRMSFSTYDRNQEVVRVNIAPRFDGAALQLTVTQQTVGDEIVFDDALLVGFDRIRLSYFGAKGQAAPAWHGIWEGYRPPRLVRLDVFDEDGAMVRFDMGVPAESPSLCTFDSVSRRCRNIID